MHFRGHHAELYTQISCKTLFPFPEQKLRALPSTIFMQDNDPKHTSQAAGQFIEDNGMDWWRTPPESPDLNQISSGLVLLSKGPLDMNTA